MKIFELLPLYIQIEIISNSIVVSGDELELSEYFYKFRKKWKDMKFRYESNQFQSIEEKMQSLNQRKLRK
jgi:predicted nucleotidyltransferase